MNAKKLYLLIGIVLMVGFLPQENVSADMGPKPTMSFEFKLEGVAPDEIVSITLMECGSSPACEDGYLFEEHFPQDVRHYFGSCDLDGCSFSYYDFDAYHRLDIQLSNGTVLKSNMFENSYYDSRYEVSITRDSLVVKELKGSNANANLVGLLLVGGFFFLPATVLVVVIVFISVVISSVRKKNTFREVLKRLGKALFWILFANLASTGLVLSPGTFILTLIVEITLAWVYLWYLKPPDRKLLLGVLFANVFTQPLFVLSQSDLGLNIQHSMNSILIVELVIWLVEAIIIYFAQKKELSFIKILILAFVLNAASFGLGLLLPI